MAAAAVRAEKAVAAAASQAKALATKVAEAQRLVAMQDRWVLCLPCGQLCREIPLVWQGLVQQKSRFYNKNSETLMWKHFDLKL